MKRLIFPLSAFAILLISVAASLAQDDRLTPEQALGKLTVAEGLQVKTFASDPGIVSISNLDVDHRGRVWACEAVNYRGNRGKRPEGDRILILEDTNGDGVSDKTTVFYQGTDIDIPMGLCVLGNKVIVAVSPEILLLEDTDGDDKADKKTVLLTSDATFQHDHSLHSFVFGPDGRFYGNFGNTGRRLKDAKGETLVDRSGRKIEEGGKPYWGGMVFRCDRNFANFEVLGHNFRNNYEATVDSFGGVWQSDNDDDGSLAVRLNYILEGGNYGYLDEVTGERWRVPRIGAHPFSGKRHWHQNDPGAVPNVIETGNGAPAGVTVYEGDLLPATVRDQVIFCESGGHLVWALPAKNAGAGFTAEKFDLLRSPDNNLRPIDAAVAPDGSLLVSDWYDPVVGGFRQADIERGRIYWVAPRGHKYAAPKYDFDTAAGAATALRSPNYCARYLAWTRLHALGEKAEAPLAAMLDDPNPRMRARALWLLGQIKGREAHYIDRAAQDRHPEVRIVGLRIADLLRHDTLAVIDRLAKDPSPRVRAECAVHLRHHVSPEAAKAWAALAAQHDGKDRWYLEALGIGADGKWDACLAAFAELKTDTSAEARNDLTWRSRSKTTPEALAQAVLATSDAKAAERYIRAFDFQDPAHKSEALLKIAFGKDVKPNIALEALQRLPAATLDADEKVRQHFAKLLTSGAPGTASIRLVKQLKLTGAYPSLLRIAQDDKSDRRLDAITALLDLKQHDLITATLDGKDTEAALSTARVLAQSNHPSATDMLWKFIANEKAGSQVRKDTAREWSLSTTGAAKLIELIKRGDLHEEMKQAVAGTLLTHSDANLRSHAEKLYPLAPASNAQPLPKLAELIAMTGNVQSGREVYFKKGICANCHRVGNEGQAVGPDLSSIGTKLARPALFEAILYPSAAISHDYENYTAKLKDGRTTTGVLVNRSDTEIQLRDAQGNLHTLDRAQVDSLDRLTVSLMPSNLHQLMTTQELVDLVEYLSTLKAGK
jgi:putative membrane-bound dehydrogenase-like protein